MLRLLSGSVAIAALVCVGSAQADMPEMVVIPAGIGVLGTPADEEGRVDDEGPQVETRHAGFEMSRFEITRGQYAAFIAATGYTSDTVCLTLEENGSWGYDPELGWRNPGFEQTDEHPVVCISQHDAQAYIAWLNARSDGPDYRLPSESEWAYAARAGSTDRFLWGDRQDDFCTYANGADVTARAAYPAWERSGACNDGYLYTAPVGSFETINAFGLADIIGNAWEWTADCYRADLTGQPDDGAPYLSADCERAVMRGGAWGDYGAFYLRTGYRGAWVTNQAFSNLGFRIVRDLD